MKKSTKNNPYKVTDNSLLNTIKEPAVAYSTSPDYSNFFTNKMEVVHSIRRGISFSDFEKIKNTMPFTDQNWADVLNISLKSMQRYKNDKTHLFKPIHTEKIFELAEVTNLGKQIFDSENKFYLWLNTPSFTLENMQPIELLKNSYGKEMVMNELYRIDNGIFA